MAVTTTHLISSGDPLWDGFITPSDDQFLSSAAAWDIPAIISRFTVLRVAATYKQLGWHPKARKPNMEYIHTTLAPKISHNDDMAAHPGLAIAHSSNFPARPKGASAETIFTVEPDVRILLLCGRQSVEVRHAAEKSIVGVFVVLHPVIVRLPSVILEAIVNFTNISASSLPPNPVSELLLAARLARLAYSNGVPGMIDPILKTVISERIAGTSTRKDKTIRDKCRRIVSSPEIVEALLETNLLEGQIWVTDGFRSVISIYVLERFTAANFIHAAAKLEERLTAFLRRSFRLRDILPPNTDQNLLEKGDHTSLRKLGKVNRSFEGLMLSAFWKIISIVASEYNLPPIFYSPWCLTDRARSVHPMNVYFQTYKDVLKSAHLVAHGFDVMHSLSHAAFLGIEHPANRTNQTWDIIQNHIDTDPQEIITMYLTPVRVMSLAASWKKGVVSLASTLHRQIDANLNVKHVPEARRILNEHIQTLLTQDREWYDLCVLFGNQPDVALASVLEGDPEILFPRFPTIDIISLASSPPPSDMHPALENIIDAFHKQSAEVQDALSTVDIGNMMQAWVRNPQADAQTTKGHLEDLGDGIQISY
ncbi:hypothetical protein GALMADRAFT_148181 [Galerina marginata CBS 339.88]|uniref:Uncharacterized protein n=1 Tax=Galerina marginata (strain CBS 339.88) TaxID=685588 RepID=A0A067SGZ1_GALM3|nr:hypothetical protein GALMADRAFT_148181 [Galerina marginata CBS 339.88]